MIAYAESSAVLCWILGEPGGEAMRLLLANAERVVTSALTPIECARGIERRAALQQMTAADALVARSLLDATARTWVLMEMTGPVPARAARRFPAEPVRTLDALHLATAAELHAALPGLQVVSLDQRIRENARLLGLPVLPETA